MDVTFSICRKITIFVYKSQKANNMKNMKAQNLPERNSKRHSYAQRGENLDCKNVFGRQLN